MIGDTAGAPEFAINIESLSAALIEHCKSCASIPLIASAPVAFESWFRAELATSLLTVGVPLQAIRFDFTYPDGCRADLAVRTSSSTIFELKCFVAGADANKCAKFPAQLARLEQCVRAGIFEQGVAFCTFRGYTGLRLATLLGRFFSPAWTVSVPERLVPAYQLQFVFGALGRSRLNLTTQ
jgi:hypothetical protein